MIREQIDLAKPAMTQLRNHDSQPLQQPIAERTLPITHGEIATDLWQSWGCQRIPAGRGNGAPSGYARPRRLACAARRRRAMWPADAARSGSAHQQEVSRCLCAICTPWCVSANIEQSLDFYCNKLGMQEVRRVESEAGRYTLVFLAAPAGQGASAAAERAPAPGAHLQLGPGEVRRGPQFRPSGLRGRRHLRHLRPADEGRRHHQPPAARRPHGLHPLARQHLASSCCRRARRSPRRSRGRRCPTPASGERRRSAPSSAIAERICLKI